MQERLQKILSARGICSRRKAEEYVTAGLVRVNGTIAKLGDKADASLDQIEVDGQILSDRAHMLYYVLEKPVGYECTNVDSAALKRLSKKKQVHSPQEVGEKITSIHSSRSPSVRDLLPSYLQGKIFPVGRLDKDSEGLLLFTNDGVLSYRLTHPKFHHEKEYDVTVDRTIEPLALRKIAEGFMLDGSMTKPIQCSKVASSRARVILTEGRNRQIRRMFQAVGYTVKRLRRVRIMTLRDDSLKAGSLRALTEGEKKKLLQSVGL